MKKNELLIVGIIAVIALIGILVVRNQKPKEIENPVSIMYHNQVIQQFDPEVDAVYHVEGDYGGLDVEVKDGKWHVINEVCPNHNCAEMGWMGLDDIFPIICIPNGIVIFPGVEENEN
jgi:hypothetical protein